MRFFGLFCVLLLVGTSLQDEFEVQYALSSEEVYAIPTTVGQTPIVPTTLELQSGGFTFTINNVGLASPPYFTLNNNPYYVLGALWCNDTYNPIYNATSQSWYCGYFQGFPLGLGTIGNISCPVGQSVFYDGTNFFCQPTSNLAANITGCVNGNTIKKVNSTSWGCQPDLDTIPTLGCSAGQMLQFLTASGWTCWTPTDANLLASPQLQNCTNGQVLELLPTGTNGAWGCANDQDTLGQLVCSPGQILKYTTYGSVGTWGCSQDSDALRYLNCPAGYTAYNNGTLSCVPAPVNNKAPPQAYIDGQLLATSPRDPTMVPTYFGSFLARETAPFNFSNGFAAVAYGFSLSVDPRTQGDTAFNFTVVLKAPGSQGAVFSTLNLPVGQTSVTTTTFVNFQPGSTGLSVVYNYRGLNLVQNCYITSTLVLAVNQPLSS